jgi:homoserine O-succinyltransferase/O-acetyltransferase
MKLKLAILDLNAGMPNQGMRCILDIVRQYSNNFDIEVFDVRTKREIPSLDFDVYICSGGPGNPLEGDGIWDVAFNNLISEVWDYNRFANEGKKFMFFICHSFQMACKHFELAKITKRKSTSFGIQPVHKTKSGQSDLIFNNLEDPFYVVESRDWQIVQPNLGVFKAKGATILALEKIRTHVEYERAIMAVRFSDEMVGTQFHPEADPHGMLVHFTSEEIREKIIDNYGVSKYDSMMSQLDDEDKIQLTHKTILPNFINNAIKVINSHAISLV